MEDCPEEVVGLAAGKLNVGVAIDSGAAGEENPEGVEACSVANKSGGGEGEIGLLHPRRMRKREIAKIRWSLFIHTAALRRAPLVIQFD